jgi:tetratricopeptide (TPR) repeat protein
MTMHDSARLKRRTDRLEFHLRDGAMKRPQMMLAFFALVTSAFASDSMMPQDVAAIAHRWAFISYQMPEKEREEAFKNLAAEADRLASASPGRAEPLVWEAIVLASYAKVQGGMGALSKVRKARDLLLAAKRIDPDTLNGSIYTALGHLYAKVPGWPIGFGDREEARALLQTALEVNPTGIDPNYFYADFLANQGDYAKAREYLNRALAAPARPGREDADAGRRRDIERLLAEISSKSHMANQ